MSEGENDSVTHENFSQETSSEAAQKRHSESKKHYRSRFPRAELL